MIMDKNVRKGAQAHCPKALKEQIVSAIISGDYHAIHALGVKVETLSMKVISPVQKRVCRPLQTQRNQEVHKT